MCKLFKIRKETEVVVRLNNSKNKIGLYLQCYTAPFVFVKFENYIILFGNLLCTVVLLGQTLLRNEFVIQMRYNLVIAEITLFLLKKEVACFFYFALPVFMVSGP